MKKELLRLEKLLRLVHKNAHKNITVSAEKIGRVYMKDDTMMYVGFVLWNHPQPVEMVEYNKYGKRLEGKGLGVLLKSKWTGSLSVIVLDSTNKETFLASARKEYISETILENLLTEEVVNELVNNFKNSNYVEHIHKTEPKNYDKTKWIERNYPVYYRYGFGWKGAKATVITNKQSKYTLLENCYESKYTQIDGKWVLLIQDYSENDMY